MRIGLKGIVFLCLAAVLALFLYICSDFRPAFATAEAASPVLIIDAGHGGEDGGAISLSGVPESRINLDIARRTDLILGLFGQATVMVRQEDISLHDSDCKTLREKKVSDLHNRVDLVQRTDGVLLSIHQNSFPSGKYSGAQVFFAPTEGSEAFARAMQEALRATVDPDNGRSAAPIPKTIYLMNHITCPAILVECGFLTNPTEERSLLDGAYQTRLAAAMAGCWLGQRGNFT